MNGENDDVKSSEETEVKGESSEETEVVQEVEDPHADGGCCGGCS